MVNSVTFLTKTWHLLPKYAAFKYTFDSYSRNVEIQVFFLSFPRTNSLNWLDRPSIQHWNSYGKCDIVTAVFMITLREIRALCLSINHQGILSRIKVWSGIVHRQKHCGEFTGAERFTKKIIPLGEISYFPLSKKHVSACTYRQKLRSIKYLTRKTSWVDLHWISLK